MAHGAVDGVADKMASKAGGKMASKAGGEMAVETASKAAGKAAGETAGEIVGRGGRKAGSRQEQILEATFRLIASEGLEGLRFSAVAARVGINNATLCYYFPTREALIRGLTERLMAQLKAGDEDRGGAVEQLRGLFADLGQRVIEDPAFFVVITELALRAQRDRKIAEIDAQRDGFWRKRIVRILERGVEEGVFRRKLDCETVALSIMVQCKGVAQHAAMGRRRAKEMTALVEEIARQVEMRVMREATR